MHYWAVKASPLGCVWSSGSHAKLAQRRVTVEAVFAATEYLLCLSETSSQSAGQLPRAAICPLVRGLHEGLSPSSFPVSLHLNRALRAAENLPCVPGRGTLKGGREAACPQAKEEPRSATKGATTCPVKEAPCQGSPGAPRCLHTASHHEIKTPEACQNHPPASGASTGQGYPLL